MKALKQFLRGTVQSVGLRWREGFLASIDLTLILPDGSTRDLAVYSLQGGDVLHVRIDGQFVPPEEL